MARERQPKIEYKVFYKGNPDYEGEFQVCDHEGLQGTFQHLHKAQEAVQACERWWNTESRLVEHEKNGEVVSEVKTTIHDNVIVWIERYVDDVHVEDDEPCEEPKGKKRKSEPAMA